MPQQPNYITAGFKTKTEALTHILSLLVENSAAAGLDGKLSLTAGGQLIVLTPKKKKE